MATDLAQLMTDELPVIRDHFDNQLAAIRSLIEAVKAEMAANHHTQVAEFSRLGRDVAEVKADVKTQNSRMSKAEQEIAFMKGQRSGGSATYNALMVGIGTLLGALGAALTLSQMGG